jgi:hypothetical protein
MRRWIIGVLVLACSVLPINASAQQESSAEEPLRVFVDCQWECDLDFIRTELDWVSYMRDRADAQVHVLVTAQTTGGGGRQFTFNFIGLRSFVGVGDTLTYTASPDDSEDVRRKAMVRVLSMGLVPFVARTAQADRIAISLVPDTAATEETPVNAQVTDPWNYWTFRIGMNGFSNGESQYLYHSLNGNISANRVTEAWKVNLGVYGNYRENTFEYEIDGELHRTMSLVRGYGLNTLVVKSLGHHLSAGLRANASTSTFGNTSLGVDIAPALEYNFMPYSESTRRQLIVRYSAGVRYADYREVTLFGEVEETRPAHNLEVEYGTTQPWGRVYLSLDGSQYLHDTGKYNAGVGGSTELRLFRGLSFNLSGNYSRVRDQLSLAARDLTEEEILLRQRQVATSYNFYFSAGISYRFGSIFNSIVNPRFGGGGGMMIMM